MTRISATGEAWPSWWKYFRSSAAFSTRRVGVQMLADKPPPGFFDAYTM
jgi:hypothetical protein